MIITRYIVRETFKNQLLILFVLLFIFFCRKLERILNATINGNISINLVLSLLGVGIPEMVQLILPLSLFLGLLITLNRMHIESEIIAIYACGFNKNILIYAALLLGFITTLLSTINVIWLSPWSSRRQELIMTKAKNDINIISLADGQFKRLENGNVVLFIRNIKDKEFERIFLAQLKPNSNNNTRPFVIIANRGYISQHPDGSQIIILDKGIRYEGSVFLHDFRITYFNQYHALIDHIDMPIMHNFNVEQMSIGQLWHSSERESRAEFHWRIMLIASVLIMSIMVVPLSVLNQRHGCLLNVLPTISAVLLYIIFFLLQTLIRNNSAKGNLDPMLWMWSINIIYLTLTIILYLWNSVFVNRLLRYLYTKRLT